MRKFDWPNLLLYAGFTGITLALVNVFAGFLQERTGAISLTILVAGIFGGVAIFLYLVIWRYLSYWFRSKIFDQFAKIVNEVKERSDSESNNPIRWRDLPKILLEVKPITISLSRYGRAVLMALVVMTVTVELLALASAAVMYLQAKRTQEQNELLASQILNDSLSATQSTSFGLNEVRRNIRFISNDLIRSLETLDEFVTAATGIIMTNDFEPVVCPVEIEMCDHISIDMLMEIVKDGPINVTEQNYESIRGYARFVNAATAMSVRLTVRGDKDELENDPLDLLENKIAAAGTSCRTGETLSRITDLWGGISVVFRETTIMSAIAEIDSVNEIGPNDEVPLEFRELGSLAWGLSEISRLLNESETLPDGPTATAKLFAQSIRELSNHLNSMLEECKLHRDSLERANLVLSQELSRILDETAGVEPDTAETE